MPKPYKVSKRGKGIAHEQRHKHFLNEQRRKQRKLIKKGILTPQRSKLSKDPSIPNIYPYKRAILEKILENNETLTREQLRRQMAQHLNDELLRQVQSGELVQPHIIEDQKDDEDEDQFISERHMRKQAFKKDLLRTVDQADILLEILDARDPENTRNQEVEQIVASKGKPLILVLNKIDLVPRDVLRAWLEYYQQLNIPAMLFKAPLDVSNGMRFANAHTGINDAGACVGGQELKHLITKLMPGAQKIVAACIGYPNTGKSSVINALAKKDACMVAPVPGQTRTVQEVHIDRRLHILDSPGVVYDTTNSVVLREELLKDPAMEVLRMFSLVRDQAEVFRQYDLDTNIENDGSGPNGGPSVQCVVDQFLQRLGNRLGRLQQNGIVVRDQVAVKVIRDWNRGKIRFWREPGELAHVRAVQAGGGVDAALLQRFNADVLGHLASGGRGAVLG